MARQHPYLASGLALAMSFSLTACAGTSGDNADGTTTLTFLSWVDEERFGPVVEAFEADHPEIDIEMTFTPPVNEYVQALQTQVLSGTAPDVFLIAAENKTNLIDGGHVVDLSGEDFVKNVEPFNLETYGRDGAYYGLSLASWAGGYVYNEDLLAEAGYDGVPETWDEFLRMCEKLKDAGITPFLEPADGIPFTMAAWLGAKTEGMDPTLDQQIFSGASSFEEEWTPLLEEYNRLFEDDVMTRDVVGLDGQMVLDEFTAGRLAVMPAGGWTVSSILEAAPEMSWSFAQIPGVDGREPYAAGAASPGYAINSASDQEHQEAAKVFLAWLASPEGTELIFEQTGDVTVTSDFEPQVDPHFEPLVDNIRSGRIYLPMIAWERSEDVLNVEAIAQLQRMVTGEITPRQMASALDAKLAAS